MLALLHGHLQKLIAKRQPEPLGRNEKPYIYWISRFNHFAHRLPSGYLFRKHMNASL